MNKFICRVTGGFGFGHRGLLQQQQVGLGLIHAGLYPAADVQGGVTGLIGRHAQQLFGIGNDDPQIAH